MKAVRARSANRVGRFEKVQTRRAQLWEEFQRTGSLDVRNKLVETYLPFVYYFAESVWSSLPDSVELADLMNVGILGLIDSISRYEPMEGIKFEAFCALRIRGEILDELRRLDWLPRAVRAKLKKLEETEERLTAELGRKPSYVEIADALGISVEKAETLLTETASLTILSLDEEFENRDDTDSFRQREMLEDRRQPKPLEKLWHEELFEIITRNLSEKNRLIILLRYKEDLSFKRIAEALQLSESQVSQMHSRILQRVRFSFAARGEDVSSAAR